MRRSLTHLGFGSAVVAAAQTSVVNIYNPWWQPYGNGPQNYSASVIDANPSATTYEVVCPPAPTSASKSKSSSGEDAGDERWCSFPLDTMTIVAGPATYNVDFVASSDSYTITAAQTCTARGDLKTLTCTALAAVTDHTETKSATEVDFIDGWTETVAPITITAGFDKLAAAPHKVASTPAKATGKPTTVGFWYPYASVGDTSPSQGPQNVLGSVVSVGPSATTYALVCPSDVTDPKSQSSTCSFPYETLTYVQGPQTFSMGYDIIQNFTQTAFTVQCTATGDSETATCTDLVPDRHDDDVTSTSTYTVAGIRTKTMAATITGGQEKLGASPGSSAASTAKATGKADSKNAAGQVQARGALVAGVAGSAVLGFVLML